MSRPRRLVILVVLVSVTVLAGGSFWRVPSGFVGLQGQQVLPEGWHLRRPFAHVTRLTARGEVRIEDLRLRTREGSDLGFRLELTYRVGSRLSPQFARDVRNSSFERSVRALADHVLQEAGAKVDAETLLATASLVESPLSVALEASGLDVSRMTFRSELGSELIRRRATEEARRLARPARGPVLLVGWDGADWEVIRPLLAAGRMPRLARLMARGAYGELRSYDPMFSPLIWTTIATGKAPTEHGIADFVVKDVASNARRPITSDFRKVKALWNVFNDFDRRSAWIAWWASYPAEPTSGLIVSDVLAPTLLAGGVDKVLGVAGVTAPESFLNDHRSLLVPWTALTPDDVSKFFPLTGDDWRVAVTELSTPRRDEPRKKGEEGTQSPVAFVCRVLSGTRTYHAIAKDALRSGVPFVAVYYEGVDMMGHRFQHFLAPKMDMVSAPDFARFQNAVPRWYEYQDQLLGELVDAAPLDTTFMIVSDHGFLSGDARPEGVLPYTSVQPAEWHRDWGILVLSGPRIRHGLLPPTSVYDVAPTLLYLEGLPIAADMPGRLVEAAFEPDELRSAAPRSLRSYELVGAAMDRAGPAKVDAAAMDEMMANLRALGYVGGDPGKTDHGANGDARAEGDAPRVDTQVYYHRNLAVSYIKQGRFQEAERELLAANERRPLAKTYSMLSEVRASQARYLDAAEALEAGWEHDGDGMEPSSLLWIIELHLLAQDAAGAERSASRWSTRMTPAVKAAVDGRMAEASGDATRAANAYRSALQADPLIVRVALRLYAIEARAGVPSTLEPFLTDTLRSHPRVDAYWDLAGQIALARGDPATAAARFGKAREIEPENGLYLGHFASASAAAGAPDEARRALAWADRFPPREGEAWMALGSAWDRLGDTDRALRSFSSAKESGLSGPGADVAAALTLARAGRREEARRVLDDVARRFPDNPAIRELQGRLQ